MKTIWGQVIGALAEQLSDPSLPEYQRANTSKACQNYMKERREAVNQELVEQFDDALLDLAKLSGIGYRKK